MSNPHPPLSRLVARDRAYVASAGAPPPSPALPRRRVHPLAWLVVSAAALGCGPGYVVVQRPPRVDLHRFQTVGLVEFSVSDGYPLREEVTHRFLATLQGLQPGVRVLELGSEREVLAAVRRETLDAAALQAVGEKFRVEAVLGGEMTVSKVQPRVTVGEGGLASIAATAKVDGTLKARLRDTEAGVTLWTSGAHGTWTLGGAQVAAGARPTIGMSDPAQVYDEMLSTLVAIATEDFRATYERQRVQEARGAAPADRGAAR